MNLLYAHPLLSGLCVVLVLSAILQLIVLINSGGSYKKNVPNAPGNPPPASAGKGSAGSSMYGFLLRLLALLLIVGSFAFIDYKSGWTMFAHHPSSSGRNGNVWWVKATPDGSDEVLVNGHPFTYDTSPKTELIVLPTRMDDAVGVGIPSPNDRYTDVGGGVKTLQFKSKIPTTVYVTIK